MIQNKSDDDDVDDTTICRYRLSTFVFEKVCATTLLITNFVTLENKVLEC